MYDLIIVGGGPCGVMAAIQASQRNKKVLLLEKNDKLLKKLELSGNGRCNITNNKEVKEFVKEIDNSKYFYAIVNQFPPKKIIAYFNNLNISLKEEDHNRMFPNDDKATTISQVLIKQLKQVEIKTNSNTIKVEKKDDNFIVTTNKTSYHSKALLLACGGFTYEELGNTKDNYNLALSFNHSLTPLQVQECPINTYQPLTELMGLSLTQRIIKVKENDKTITTEQGDVLFTHFGLSGPGILNCSFGINKATNKDNTYLAIQLLNKDYEQTKTILNEYLTANPKQNIKTFLNQHLPNKLSEYLVNTVKITVKNAELNKKQINELCHLLSNFEFKFKSFYKPEHAFVSGGGINIKELKSKTLESKLISNLYLGGEYIDVCGKLGGYNITLALACGYVVGNNL